MIKYFCDICDKEITIPKDRVTLSIKCPDIFGDERYIKKQAHKQCAVNYIGVRHVATDSDEMLVKDLISKEQLTRNTSEKQLNAVSSLHKARQTIYDTIYSPTCKK